MTEVEALKAQLDKARVAEGVRLRAERDALRGALGEALCVIDRALGILDEEELEHAGVAHRAFSFLANAHGLIRVALSAGRDSLT